MPVNHRGATRPRSQLAARASASGLIATQRWLFERVTQSPAARPSRQRQDARRVKSSAGWSSGERVAVYQNGYRSRLIECLQDDYPAVAHAMGVEAFEALCADFIDTHPPTSPSLNSYGAPFAEFCAGSQSPLAALIGELARLEWAVVQCIHSDAQRTLDPTTLAGLSEAAWPRARLVASPACRILDTSYPVDAYYGAFLRGEEPQLPAPEPCTVAVSRCGDDVGWLRIDPHLTQLLHRLARAEPLASALASLEAEGAPSAAELTRALSQWVSRGLFTAVSVD